MRDTVTATSAAAWTAVSIGSGTIGGSPIATSISVRLHEQMIRTAILA
jgi:hypothetical protein